MIAVAGLLATGAAVAVFNSDAKTHTAVAAASPWPTSSTRAERTPLPPAEPATGTRFSVWEYSSQADPVTRKRIDLAALTSINQLSLKHPYGGTSRARVGIRQSPRDGLAVLFSIDKGQLMCREAGCSVTVAFDGGEPERFSMSRPRNQSGTMLFFDDKQRFIRAARKAKEFRISASVYPAGDQVLVFATSEGLKWPPPQ